MSPEQLDKARADEAHRLWHEVEGGTQPSTAIIAARLAREGWTPPDPISPRVLAAEEYAAEVSEYRAWCQATKEDFLAGFAAAVKLAEPVVDLAESLAHHPDDLDTIAEYRRDVGAGQ